jgi:20S proteasome alpha/beta subunit
MTLILGMYYDNEKGVLIASESRCLCELDILPQTKKIYNINQVIFSLSGITYLSDELIEDLEKKIKPKMDSQEITETIRQSFVDLREKYATGENPQISKKNFECSGLFGFYSNKPEIFELSNKGIPFNLNEGRITAVGQWKYATQILKSLYRKDITKEQAIKAAVYTINEISKTNAGIDSNIQLATIDKEETKIWNIDKNGEFIYNLPEFEIIKEEVKEVPSLQRKALNILLFGEKEEKSKLEKLLKEL